MNANQRGHIFQWLIIIVFIELFLFFGPVYNWLKLALIGFAFIMGFLIRLFKKYPGESEPLIVDLSTGAIAFLLILFFTIVKNLSLQFAGKILAPFIILIPHFIYIFRNKKIKPPGFRNIIRKFLK